MGWSSGTNIINAIWKCVGYHLSDINVKIDTAKKILNIFEEHDYDAIEESDIYYFLMFNDDDFLKEQMKIVIDFYESPEELANDFKMWRKDNNEILNIAMTLF